MKNFARLLWIVFLAAACDGEGTLRRGVLPEYLPLVKGAYQVYTVNEKRYFSATSVEELQYELKAEVADSFPSGDELYTYVIHRSVRTEDEPWQSLDTWSVRRAANEYVVSEGTTSYVKLKLPYNPDNTWDGNTYNNLGADQYGYGMIGLSYDLNGITFEHTLEVQQELNDDPIVFRDERREIYAAGVGLIYKELTQLHYCTDDACLGQQKVEQGTEMKMVMTEYGKR